MIDSHCHINDDIYFNKSKEYIEEAQKAGVQSFFVIGCDLKTSLRAVELAKTYNCCYAAVGIHPEDALHAGENDLELIEKLLSEKVVKAVGEIGLDYYWEKDEKMRDLQRKYFISQINLANKYSLPVVIHCRDAYGEVLEILKNHKVIRGGVMHCYGGSKELALEFIKLGFVIGIGGTCTFKNAVHPKEVAASIPNNSFILETDAPYLAPTPHRGEPNHSKYIPLIRERVALLRNQTVEEVEKETDETFKRIFL